MYPMNRHNRRFASSLLQLESSAPEEVCSVGGQEQHGSRPSRPSPRSWSEANVPSVPRFPAAPVRTAREFGACRQAFLLLASALDPHLEEVSSVVTEDIEHFDKNLVL